MKSENKLLLLNAVFITGMMIANFLGLKLMEWGPFILSVGTPIMALTFLCTDIISDVWGKEQAKRAIQLGFLASLIAMLYTQFAVRIGHPAHWGDQESFEIIFGSQWRLVFASLTSYLISQYVDVTLFHAIKGQTGQKHLWLRNNVSTGVSQMFDTVVFTILAFAGTMPATVLISIMLSQYGLRFILALLDTPLCYLGVAWANKED